MPERDAREGRPTNLELDIIRTFGWGLIALEETMFQRYLQLSARSSLMTRDDFRSILFDMESKGFLVSTSMHGKRAFRKLLVNGEGASIHPKVPLDEMRLVLGSLKAKQDAAKMITSMKPKKRIRGPRITSEVISESQMISEEIIRELEECILEESGIRKKAAIHMHIEKMIDALSESDAELFEYVRSELPKALQCLGRILNAQGTDILTLSLKLAEPKVRRYLA